MMTFEEYLIERNAEFGRKTAMVESFCSDCETNDLDVCVSEIDADYAAHLDAAANYSCHRDGCGSCDSNDLCDVGYRLWKDKISYDSMDQGE